MFGALEETAAGPARAPAWHEPPELVPARLAALIGYGVSARLVATLCGSRRLRPRVDAMIDARLGPLPPLAPAQRRALGLDTEGLATLARQAGGVWHADRIAAIVTGPEVRALSAAIGEPLRLLSLRGRHLAGGAEQAPREQPPGELTPVDAIADAISGMGQRCLLAWCDAQPPAVGQHLALRLNVVPAAPLGAPAAAIVQWLLEAA